MVEVQFVCTDQIKIDTVMEGYPQEISEVLQANKHTTKTSTASDRLVLKELSRLFNALTIFGTYNRLRAFEQKYQAKATNYPVRSQ